ncbi:MAG: IS3 family transposase [Trueperaceae bacterium]|nr:IS3 family transposase [Trueperaceae bacterium]
MRFQFIADNQTSYPIILLCKIMRVSRSGYYDFLKRKQQEMTKRQLETTELIAAIKLIFEENKQRYGSPRIHRELKKRGYVCSLARVKKLMRQEGLYALSQKKYKPKQSSITLDSTPNLLVPKPEIVQANQVWYSDITFIKTLEGWLYLVAIMDAYSKRIVGYAMAEHMRTELVIQALRMATKQRCFSKGLIHHSHKGSQYTSYAYQRELRSWGLKPSFTGTKACLDNAYIESFFATLKKELVYQTNFHTRDQARAEIFEFIEIYYNRYRFHSSLNYQTPTEFEEQALIKLAA